MITLPMSYFDAWTIGLLNSQYRHESGMVDNEGVDCLYMKTEIEKEMKKYEKMDFQKSARA